MSAVSCNSLYCRPGQPCRRCAQTIAELDAPRQIAWFESTEHCGGCGQPGAFCLCTERYPCGCRDLHPMGSGIDADPAAVFAAPADDNQGELFSDPGVSA